MFVVSKKAGGDSLQKDNQMSWGPPVIQVTQVMTVEESQEDLLSRSS